MRNEPYTQIPHEILEAFYCSQLQQYESRLFIFYCRKIYGFHKTEDWITNTQAAKEIGIRDCHVSRAKTSLIQRNMITQRGRKISINGNTKQWRGLPDGATRHDIPQRKKDIPNEDVETTPSGKQSLPRKVDTIDKKETFTKDNEQKDLINFENFKKACEEFDLCNDKKTESIINACIASENKDVMKALTMCVHYYKLDSKAFDKKTAAKKKFMEIERLLGI